MTRALPSGEKVPVSRVPSESGKSRRDWAETVLEGALALAVGANIFALFRKEKKEASIPLLRGRQAIETEARLWGNNHASDIFLKARITQFVSLKSSTRLGTWRKPWAKEKIQQCADGLVAEKQADLLARAMKQFSAECGDHEELSVYGAQNRMRSMMDDQLEWYCSEILK